MDYKYLKLIELLSLYPDHLDIIKNHYLSLLSELTISPNIDDDKFIKNISKIHDIGTIIVCYSGSPKADFNIIASGTIIIEPKIIRNGLNVGHIEDIVVTKSKRGQGISNIILSMLQNIARENNCYKIILDCSEDVKNVYIKNGFEIKGIQMAAYL
jgi:glucosamine-phosphate N-acetyltransferase